MILPTPSPLPEEVKRETEATKDKVQTTNLEITAHVQPLVVQVPIPKPKVALKPNPKPLIPYPLRHNDQKLREKDNNQMLKFLQMFQRLHFDICFADALLHLPKFASMFKSLLNEDEQLIFHTDTTSKYPNKHRIESVKMINFIDIPCEDNFKEVLKIKKLSHHLSGSTTSTPDSSPSLTTIETSDSLLEEFADKLALLDPFPPGIGDTDFDVEGDILLLEKLLNDDPSSPLPPKEINFEELKMIKSLIDDFFPLNILGGNFMTFSNPLFDANDYFTSSDDESLPEEDELEDIESNESYVSNLDEPVLSVTPLSDANEDECFNPRGDIDEINAFIDMDVSTVIKDGYHDSKGDEIFLEYLLKKIASMDSSLLFSSDSEDIIFDPGILVFRFYSLEPVDFLDYEDSRAHGFVHRSLELLSLACLYIGIQYPRSY
ncbi:hypothetical protein Tco_1186811 [Tanacetum coccineum]